MNFYRWSEREEAPCVLKSRSNCVLPVQPTMALPNDGQRVTMRSTLLKISVGRVVLFGGWRKTTNARSSESSIVALLLSGAVR